MTPMTRRTLQMRELSAVATEDGAYILVAVAVDGRFEVLLRMVLRKRSQITPLILLRWMWGGLTKRNHALCP